MPIEIDTDSKGLVDNVNNVRGGSQQTKRRSTDVADFKQCIAFGVLRNLTFIARETNPTDSMTKSSPVNPGFLIEMYTTGTYRT